MPSPEGFQMPASEPGPRREGPLFPLGQTLATPGALGALGQAGESPLGYLARHVRGDWGDVDTQDWQANDDALRDGDRLFSAYTLSTQERMWIITEADRSSTTLLLPEEY